MRIVREAGKPVARVARELGVNEGTLGNWVALDRQRREKRDGVLDADERAELARLRCEVAELAMERDVLKRSIALRVLWRTRHKTRSGPPARPSASSPSPPMRQALDVAYRYAVTEKRGGAAPIIAYQPVADILFPGALSTL